jgi:hypothetical protein
MIVPPKKASIFVLIDALGWEWIKSEPFLSSVAPYRRPLESVVGYSTSAIPSILTGRYPYQHGRMSLFELARSGNSPFRGLAGLICAMPPAMVENRYARYAVRQLARVQNNFTGFFILHGVPLRYLPLLDICEKNDIYQPGGIPGSTSIFDLLKQRNINHRVYNYRQGPDSSLFAAMEKDLQNGKASFYFLYLAEVDAFLHLHAHDPAAVSGLLKTYSDSLTRLYQTAAASYAEVSFHLFADHGMAPTIREVDLERKLKTLGLREKKDYLYLLDSTLARFWFFSASARKKVVGAIRDDETGHWMTEAELRSLGAWFDDHRYGDAIFLMNEGSVIAPGHMGRHAPKGMHGFHPAARHSLASFMSSVDYGDRLKSITDIYSIMAEHAV